MAYAKECAPAGMELIPYEGDNPFKQGTAVCAGCGIRCSRDTGLPTEGNACSLVPGGDATSMESQRAAVAKAVEAAMAQANEDLVAQAKAAADEIEELKKQLAEAKAVPPTAPAAAASEPTKK